MTHNSDESHKVPDPTPSEHIEIFWRMVMHENALINYRFFWGVFVNAGLLTFFTSELVRERAHVQFFLAYFALAWSVAIAVMCLAALRAEAESLNRIETILKKWTFPSPEFGCRMTTMRGGGSLCWHRIAAVCSYYVFVAMVLFWIAVVVALHGGLL